jgi:hypothetical protein
MIKSFVMAGAILGAASSFAVAQPVTTIDQYGNTSTGIISPGGVVTTIDQYGNTSTGIVTVTPGGIVTTTDQNGNTSTGIYTGH